MGHRSIAVFCASDGHNRDIPFEIDVQIYSNELVIDIKFRNVQNSSEWISSVGSWRNQIIFRNITRTRYDVEFVFIGIHTEQKWKKFYVIYRGLPFRLKKFVVEGLFVLIMFWNKISRLLMTLRNAFTKKKLRNFHEILHSLY